VRRGKTEERGRRAEIVVVLLVVVAAVVVTEIEAQLPVPVAPQTLLL